MKSSIKSVIVAVVAAIVVGLGGWTLANSAEHDSRIAVVEEKARTNDNYHTENTKRFDRIEGKIDDILERLYDRDCR